MEILILYFALKIQFGTLMVGMTVACLPENCGDVWHE